MKFNRPKQTPVAVLNQANTITDTLSIWIIYARTELPRPSNRLLSRTQQNPNARPTHVTSASSSSALSLSGGSKHDGTITPPVVGNNNCRFFNYCILIPFVDGVKLSLFQRAPSRVNPTTQQIFNHSSHQPIPSFVGAVDLI